MKEYQQSKHNDNVMDQIADVNKKGQKGESRFAMIPPQGKFAHLKNLTAGKNKEWKYYTTVG
jgi:hypothetical protein